MHYLGLKPRATKAHLIVPVFAESLNYRNPVGLESGERGLSVFREEERGEVACRDG